MAGHRWWIPAAAVTVLVLAACGGVQGTPSANPSSPHVSEEPEAWDLVAIGDSMVAGYGVLPDDVYTRVYARLLGEELGLTVNVLEHVDARDPGRIADWIEVLTSDESLRSDLARAEIVTVFLGFHDIGMAVFEECSGAWPDPLEACFREATAPMPDDFDELFAQIRDLVPDGIPILMGYDGGLPPLPQYETQPYWQEMRRILVDDWRPGLYAAAEAHDVTVIGWYEALNGPAGEALHPEFLTADQGHFNPAGHRFLAELHLAQDGLGNE